MLREIAAIACGCSLYYCVRLFNAQIKLNETMRLGAQA
jgi:hypothetical protein